MCRASSACIFDPDLSGGLVSYRSAIGRFAEIVAGESIRIVTPNGSRKAFVGNLYSFIPASRKQGETHVPTNLNLLSGKSPSIHSAACSSTHWAVEKESDLTSSRLYSRNRGIVTSIRTNGGDEQLYE